MLQIYTSSSFGFSCDSITITNTNYFFQRENPYDLIFYTFRFTPQNHRSVAFWWKDLEGWFQIHSNNLLNLFGWRILGWTHPSFFSYILSHYSGIQIHLIWSNLKSFPKFLHQIKPSNQMHPKCFARIWRKLKIEDLLHKGVFVLHNMHVKKNKYT